MWDSVPPSVMCVLGSEFRLSYWWRAPISTEPSICPQIIGFFCPKKSNEFIQTNPPQFGSLPTLSHLSIPAEGPPFTHAGYKPLFVSSRAGQLGMHSGFGICTLEGEIDSKKNSRRPNYRHTDLFAYLRQSTRVILPPLPPKCWNYRRAPPCLVCAVLRMEARASCMLSKPSISAPSLAPKLPHLNGDWWESLLPRQQRSWGGIRKSFPKEVASEKD